MLLLGLALDPSPDLGVWSHRVSLGVQVESVTVTFPSAPPQGLAVSFCYAVLQCGHHGESLCPGPGCRQVWCLSAGDP